MRKLVTKLLKTISLFLVILCSQQVHAQISDFHYTIANDVQVSDRILEFDIFLLDTDANAPFELAAIQAGITVNPGIYNGGTITLSIVAGSSQLSNLAQRPTSVLWDQVTNVIKLTPRSSPGAGSGSIISQIAPGTRICRLRITNSKAFTSSSTANLTFSFSQPPYPTKVSQYISGTNTVLSCNSTNTFSNAANIVINPPVVPPIAFSVTGGGSYCANTGGLPVGLTDSETGVTYTLHRNVSETITTVPGTGEAISFGNQLAGTYTVTGTNTGGTTTMSGSAVITETALVPVSVSISASANNICAGISVTFTATPTNGGTTPAYQWKVNNVNSGTNSSSFTYVPADKDVVTCILTSNVTCPSGPATSNTITMNINPNVTASVSITANPAGAICAGTLVTFTAIPVNGGTNPDYQWKKNGTNIGGAKSSSYETSSLANGDIITVQMTSNAPCVIGSPTSSNAISMNVTPLAGTPTTPTPSGTTICQGSGTTTYTTSAANATSYNWSVSGTGNTITGTGPTSTVTWAASYYGTATIRVSANGCNGQSAEASTTVLVNQKPAAPTIGTITQTTCFISTGSIQLNGLPASGDWTVTRFPGGIPTAGNGTTTTISGLVPDTYNFTVTNSSGCISASSLGATINAQPGIPTPPVIGTITAPTCTVSTGSVQLTGLPSGSWTVRRYPGGVPTTGSATSVTISGLAAITYNFTVTNASGCVSELSENADIPGQPVTPPAPTVGSITQPTCTVATGSVTLNNLPSGDWTINPGDRTGTGSSTTITGLGAGTHNFTVTNESGCTSVASENVVINTQPVTPSAPTIGTITPPTCSVATGSVVLGGLPAGTWIITRMPGGATTTNSGTSTTITGLPAEATYTFTVTNSTGCISAASAPVIIIAQPVSPAVPTQNVNCSLGFGNAVVTVTSPIGPGLEYSLDGGGYTTSTIFNGVANGNYYIAVRNSAGCTTTGLIFSVSCGCNNPTTLLLTSYSGTTCGTAPVTVSGNTFGGSATSVTITDDGGGTVTPASATTSPFPFTYTPVAADIGKVITITVRTNNPVGGACTYSEATYSLTVNAVPSAPAQGTITQPSCLVATGSILVTGLPSGTWTLSRTPGGVATGSGTSTLISGLDPGIYSFTVTNAAGCTSPSSEGMTVNPQPSAPTAPVTGTITQPTCITSTGSIELRGLPSSGNWTVTRTPGGVSKTGNGTTTTIANVPAGTFTFTVTNSNGCISVSSEEVIINPQPATPLAPSVGTITSPGCTLATGSVVLMGLPSTGSWTLTRYIGGITTEGEGISATISGLPSGTYNYTVTTSSGCVSVLSANVVIPAQPATPAAPVVGIITQPTSSVPTGSVVLSGLPSGNWVITRSPGAVTTTGTTANITITGLPAGVFTFTVANAAGCISQASIEVIISTPGTPDLFITDPAAACANTADITASSITAGSTPGLTYTYWKDANATIPYDTPAAATDGTYYIKGTTVSGYYDIKPVIVKVDEMPVPNAGEDQVIDYNFNTLLDADLTGDETGIWSLVSGTANFDNNLDAKAKVSNLSLGRNILLWTVTSGVCPSVSDQVVITVNDLIIPTLITPNGDSKNEKFVLRGLESLGKTELLIFDRRGAQVYKNMDYDNSWNGTDYNGKDLQEDTYFYILKSANGKSLSGYIVIRR